MQRDGNSDDRAKAGASGRTPPVIEGDAVEVSTTAAVEPAERQPESAPPDPAVTAGPPDGEGVEEAEAEPVAEIDAPSSTAPREKTRRGGLVAIGVVIVALAGVVAWIATPGQRAGDGSLKSRAIALLPESAQRVLHVAPATKPVESPSSAAVGERDATAEKPVASAPQNTAPADDGKAAEAAKSDATPADRTTAESRPAAPGASDAAKAPEVPATIAVAPPAAAGADIKPAADVSAQIEGLQAKLDAALGRIDALQSKVELAQGKLEGVAAADAVAQAAQRLETLTQRIAAIEQKLEQPKADARATQARENNGPTGREFAASRAVVAQATTEALRAGAPLADDLAALKGLGVADEKIADLTAYAKTGAPTLAQLTQQWRGLRDKTLALEAPAPGASFSDKLLAKAKSVFRVTWAGHGAQNSIGATVARVDGALAKNDLAGAVAACDDFPAVAKNLVADWQVAATARLKADAAARALLSESISAIGRSSSQ